MKEYAKIVGGKKILLVLDRYKRGGLETHSNLLKKEFNADICYKNNDENFTKYSINLLLNYEIIIWQNTFIDIDIDINISQKKENQKFFYVVHCQCDWWNKGAIKIIKKNNELIDKYIFVSDSVKKSFEKFVFPVKNSIIIENRIETIENKKDIKKGLFISSGSFHKMKNHYNLILEFSKLDKEINTLEIYGDVSDRDYYDKLKKYIEDNLLFNIKLFEYNDNDIYIERLKEAEYFILFSQSEGCSYSILEAMALNKKIICSKECVTFEQIKNYNKKIIVSENNIMYFDICNIQNIL